MRRSDETPLASTFANEGRAAFTFDRDWWLVTLGSVILLAVALLIDRVPIIAGFAAPSGADPGNWLTFARELSGEHVRLAGWAYPPATFWLLRLFLVFLAPLTALKLLGFVTWLGLGSTFLLLLRWRLFRLPFYIQLGLTILFMLAGYQGEIYAWGGYPQLLGMSFLLLGLPLAEQWFDSGQVPHLFVAALMLAGVIYAHHLLTAMLPVLLILLFIWHLAGSQDRRRLWWRGLTLAGLLTLLALPVAPTYWQIALILVGNPVNANGFSADSAPLMLNYVFRDAFVLWLALVGVSFVLPLRLRGQPLMGTLFVLTWGTLLLLLFFWEVRMLQLIVAGAGLGLASIIAMLWDGPGGDSLAAPRQLSLLLGLSAILFWVLPAANEWFRSATEQGYRIVDADFLAALQWVGANTDQDERIAASYADYPQGWWIEGFSRRQTLYATDSRWLFFEEERTHTAVANIVFAPDAPTEQVETYLRDYDVGWFFVDKSAGAVSLPDLPNFDLTDMYENERILIVRIETTQ